MALRWEVRSKGKARWQAAGCSTHLKENWITHFLLQIKYRLRGGAHGDADRSEKGMEGGGPGRTTSFAPYHKNLKTMCPRLGNPGLLWHPTAPHCPALFKWGNFWTASPSCPRQDAPLALQVYYLDHFSIQQKSGQNTRAILRGNSHSLINLIFTKHQLFTKQ